MVVEVVVETVIETVDPEVANDNDDEGSSCCCHSCCRCCCESPSRGDNCSNVLVDDVVVNPPLKFRIPQLR